MIAQVRDKSILIFIFTINQKIALCEIVCTILLYVVFMYQIA